MIGTRKDSPPDPSRRAVLGAGSALLGANLVPVAAAPAAAAELAQLSLLANAPETPPPGYNILFIFVDQEHFFEKWPFPVPGRKYLKKNGTTFANHQVASQVCSSARSVVYTGQHIQHTGVFDNMELPWQPSMSTDVVTIGASSAADRVPRSLSGKVASQQESRHREPAGGRVVAQEP
jgi:hypothetical protein